MHKSRYILISSLLMFTVLLYSEAFPSSAGLSLPGTYMGWTDPSLFLDSTVADARLPLINPAGAASFELPQYTFALGSIFPKHASSEMAAAFDVSLSALYPLPFAVLWGGIEGLFIPKQIPDMKDDGGLSLAVGLSKRLGEHFSASFGISSVWPLNPGNNWTLGLALGFQQFLPSLGAGGSIFYGSLVNGGNGPEHFYPFTLLAGWKTILLKSPVDLAVGLQVASPAFKDLLVQPAFSASFGRLLSLSVGWNSSLFYGDKNSWFPTISLTLTSNGSLKLQNVHVIPRLKVQPVWSQGIGAETAVTLTKGEKDRQGPQIQITAKGGDVYSSKVQRAIDWEINMEDDTDIATWNASIEDESKSVLFTRSETNPKHARSLRFSLSVPLDSSWKDGAYTMVLIAQDRYGNSSKASYPFTLDSNPPAASIRIEANGGSGSTIFSPNGDGERDLLFIYQRGTRESLWTGSLLNAAGNIIRSFTWTEMEAPDVVWDGRDGEGRLVPDGTYLYRLSSTDKAGNSFSVISEPIIVDAQPRRLAISLSYSTMSTDPAASVSGIAARFSDYLSAGLSGWTIQIIDSQGRVYRSWQGKTANLDQFPNTLTFNGLTDQKDAIPDGTYRFMVIMDYTNGDRVHQTSAFFSVVSQKPSGHVRASQNIVSIQNPEGVLLFHDLSPDAEWQGIITDTNQKVIKRFPIGRITEPVIRWQGDTDTGAFAEPGTYLYLAEGMNAVGLVGRTVPVRLTVDPLKRGTLVLQPNVTLFSGRTGDGRIVITPRYQDIGTITAFAFSIRNVQSQIVVKEEKGTLPGIFLWDGRDSLGILCPDGTYQAELTLYLGNGSVLSAASLPVTLDSTPPKVAVSAKETIFSPNGDGNLDTVTFTISAEGSATWTASIVDFEGNTVRQYAWKEAIPATLVWDGKDGGNMLVRDGSYRLFLEGTDLAGNKSTAMSNPVRLDARTPSAAITSDLLAFAPNGDGFADSVQIRLVTAFSDGISRLQVAVKDRNGAIIRRFITGSTLSQSSQYLWDGTADNGTIAPDGEYIPWAEVEYLKGDLITVSGKPIRLDRSAPQVSITLEPQPFSPDDDGVNDILSIAITAVDASGINGWKLSIVDPAGNIFTSFSGKTLPPEPIRWDGYNLDNELIEAAQEYSYIVQVRDTLGNMATVKGTLSTDVFVIKDGDRLKIRISSIVFPPNSASLYGTDQETTSRNKVILDRVAAVLKKYASYRIRVEGHGVNLSGTEREERTELEALSLARARAVLDALVERGIDRSRLEARGLGGREPLVPHTDQANRWKNRRVEFILMR
ncbi:FlgD immunoglobulin-like domain containing protein [Gracilinema caldarium]|uniref:FlgD immunoglobulin-like domain containing protein n=1 Tax=Gracilinema caldarium TaxID=215591 RepID=UPI0026E9A0ED|nr:FlgD immunoglobulin-like domain containing protein [Gracilinema caldarium]